MLAHKSLDNHHCLGISHAGTWANGVGLDEPACCSRYVAVTGAAMKEPSFEAIAADTIKVISCCRVNPDHAGQQ